MYWLMVQPQSAYAKTFILIFIVDLGIFKTSVILFLCAKQVCPKIPVMFLLMVCIDQILRRLSDILAMQC